MQRYEQEPQKITEKSDGIWVRHSAAVRLQQLAVLAWRAAESGRIDDHLTPRDVRELTRLAKEVE